ncbi:hypothetical protein BCE02nite_07530 [Brevibacillus centrosporus]|nr:hypothetical protein BCE02nite_07530 [Brevibacillus centrosporus]
MVFRSDFFESGWQKAVFRYKQLKETGGDDVKIGNETDRGEIGSLQLVLLLPGRALLGTQVKTLFVPAKREPHCQR